MAANPIRLIEEAIVLLRRQDMRSWSQYLLAAVPFLLTLLLFFRDMSSGYLADRCAVESLACTLAFLWASAWKAKFGATLLTSMNGPAASSQQGSFFRALYLQSILQTLKLLVLPFAIVSIFPIAWTTSFFRNATIESGLTNTTLRQAISKSARRAGVNGRANWLALAILIVIFLIAFINVYMLVGLLPLLLRMFTGIESMFTRDLGSLVHFNVLCVVLAITWLIFDALLLSYAVVRCFYTEARSDGRDLLALLRPVAAAPLIVLTLATPKLEADTISHEKLSIAVKQAAQSSDYDWLRVGQHTSQAADNTFAASLNRDLTAVVHAVRSWLRSFRNWVRRLLETDKPDVTPEAAFPLSADVRWLLYALAALVLIAALFIVFRSMNKSSEPHLISSASIQTPDLNKDQVLASDLPEEEWLRMARECIAQGELRLAVRALYLSNLSHLDSLHFIQIARSKTNSIYERELRLRPHSSAVSVPFAQSNRNFERAWYGFHQVTPDFVELFQQHVEAIRQHAKA